MTESELQSLAGSIPAIDPAHLDAAQARLDLLLARPFAEDIAVAEAEVAQGLAAVLGAALPDVPDAEIDRYLGQPAPIRVMKTAEPLVRNLDPPGAGSILEISMTVMPNGRLEDVEIIHAPANLSAEQSLEIRQVLQGALFRPAVVDGKVHALEGFVWKVPAFRSGVSPDTPTPGGAIS